MELNKNNVGYKQYKYLFYHVFDSHVIKYNYFIISRFENVMCLRLQLICIYFTLTSRKLCYNTSCMVRTLNKL
jgi:hypothetical protein